MGTKAVVISDLWGGASLKQKPGLIRGRSNKNGEGGDMNQLLSRSGPERPVNMGEFYFIREKVNEVRAWERSENRKEELCLWMKRIVLAILVIASMAAPVILTLAAG